MLGLLDVAWVRGKTTEKWTWGLRVLKQIFIKPFVCRKDLQTEWGCYNVAAKVDWFIVIYTDMPLFLCLIIGYCFKLYIYHQTEYRALT